MYGSATGPPIGFPPLVNPVQRTGPSGWSSQAAIQAANSVFAVPLRSDSAARLNRRRPACAWPFG
jgi:hypothetical protein